MNEFECIEKIAQKVFQLFIANPKALAIQQESGHYITKYISFDYQLIANMYRRNGSAGCYQQGLKNDLIKWICLDFDCKDTENPNISELLKILKETVLNKLIKLQITYLLEFSGRRGIHIWILFEEPISKINGYQIISKLCNDIIFDTTQYGLDKFPATDSSEGNKVGKQVKIPLSVHKRGGRSYFIEGESYPIDIHDKNFFRKQLHILETYKPNKIEYVNKKLNIDINELYIQKKYKTIISKNNLNINIEQLRTTLSNITAYKNIFYRLENEVLTNNDWNVLLGTFGPLDDNGEFLISIVSNSTCYDPYLTKSNIEKWKQYYFPPTFGYLYNLYNLKLEKKLKKDETAYDYLHSKIPEFDFAYITDEIKKSNNFTNIESIIERERNYLFYNDENIPIKLYNHFNNISNYDVFLIKKYVNDLSLAKKIFPQEFTVWKRIEAEDKIRELVTLDFYDRVLTTYLAIQLASKINIKLKKSESFSYKIADLSKNEIFYNWYSGWSQFIDKIKSYLEIPYLDDWGVFYIDIRHFYDSIDFVVLNKLIEPELDKDTLEIYTFLTSEYNEKLMKKINGIPRIGVPQGPAYARIISEIFLSKILQVFETTYSEDYILYRYVDDIVVFYPSKTNGNILYEKLIQLLEINLLNINEEKSFFGGKISDLTQEQKDKLLHKDKLSYLLQENSSSIMLSDEQERLLFNEFIGSDFNLDYVSFIFNEKTKETVRWSYFLKFKDEIFNSEYGRGSIFLRFYKFVFTNEKYFNIALCENSFIKIPINSLNFKTFLTELYLTIQSKTINNELLKQLYTNYLIPLDLKNIEENEKSIISAIRMYMENKNVKKV